MYYNDRAIQHKPCTNYVTSKITINLHTSIICNPIFKTISTLTDIIITNTITYEYFFGAIGELL